MSIHGRGQKVVNLRANPNCTVLGQVAQRVGNGDYVKAELTAEAAQTLANSPDSQPGQVLHKVV